VGPALAVTNTRPSTAAPLDTPPPERQTPLALADLQRTEIAKWWPIIKDAGIKAD
jgi:hypothetical protein